MRCLTFFLVLLVSWHCFGADFKVTAPPQWKLVDNATEGPRIYRNSRSSTNESVAIHSFQMENPDSYAHQRLHEKVKEFTELRRRFLAGLGVRDYTVLSTERRSSTNPRFGYFQVIQANFVGANGADVQTLERQFLRKGKLFVITYLIDAPALSHRTRAEQVLDLFQPQTDPSDREPAAAGEVLSAVGASARVGVSTYGSDAFNKSDDLDMRDPRIQALCRAVPSELRRSEGDKTFLGVGSTMLWAFPKCGQGVWDNFENLWKGATSLVSSASHYMRDSTYRDQVNASAGAMASEFWKDKTGLVKKSLYALRDFVVKAVGETFFCLKPAEQIRALCNFATNFVSPGMMWKLVTKTPLLGPELARLSGQAKEFVGSYLKGPKGATGQSPPEALARSSINPNGEVLELRAASQPTTPLGESLQRAHAAGSAIGLDVSQTSVGVERLDYPIKIKRPNVSPIAHKMRVMQNDLNVEFRLRPGAGDLRELRFLPGQKRIVPIAPDMLADRVRLRAALEELDRYLRSQVKSSEQFELAISGGRSASGYRVPPEAKGARLRESVHERLKSMGLDPEPRPNAQGDFDFTVRAGRERSLNHGAGDLAKTIQSLSEERQLKFRLASKRESGLAEHSSIHLESKDRTASPEVTVNLGKDFLENPVQVKERLSKIKKQLDAFAAVERDPNVRVIVRNMDLQDGSVKGQLLIPGTPTSGPFLWIKNRQKRHGFRVFIEDDAFTGPMEHAGGFVSASADVYLRSSFFNAPLQDQSRLVAHELQHAFFRAQCAKDPSTCWRVISFAPHQKDGFVDVPRYENGFHVDELEAFKVDGRNDIAETFIPDQLRLLQEARQRIAEGNIDLMRSRPFVDVPDETLGSEVLPGAHVRFQSLPKEIKDPAAAKRFYLDQIDRRIKAVTTIADRDYSYVSLGRKRPGLFENTPHPSERMPLIRKHLSGLGLRIENEIRPFADDAVSFDIVPSDPSKSEIALIMERLRSRFGASFEGNNFDASKSVKLSDQRLSFDRPLVPISPVMYDSPYAMKKQLLELEKRLFLEKAEAQRFEGIVRPGSSSDLYRIPTGSPAEIKSALAARLKTYGLNAREARAGDGASWELEVGGRSEDTRLTSQRAFAAYRDSIENLRRYGGVRFSVRSEAGSLPEFTRWRNVVDKGTGREQTVFELGRDFFETPTVVFKIFKEAEDIRQKILKNEPVDIPPYLRGLGR